MKLAIVQILGFTSAIATIDTIKYAYYIISKKCVHQPTWIDVEANIIVIVISLSIAIFFDWQVKRIKNADNRRDT
jgi:hypothetical protein